VFDIMLFILALQSSLIKPIGSFGKQCLFCLSTETYNKPKNEEELFKIAKIINV
jgi:hypothetical protein